MNKTKFMISRLLAVCLVLALMPVAQAANVCTHTWEMSSYMTPPTCTTPGIGFFWCTKCRYQEEHSVPALGHHWGGWIVDTEPTCAQTGRKHRFCNRCQAVDTADIDLLPHGYGRWTVLKAATCTAYGQKTSKCMACGKRGVERIPKAAHAWSEWYLIKPSSANSIGINERRCGVCGLTERDTFYPEGTLRRDNKKNNKEEVKKLQEILAQKGFKAGKADGYFGKRLEAAIKGYQKAAGLRQDGIAWPETQDHVFERKPQQEAKISVQAVVIRESWTDNGFTEGDQVRIQLGVHNVGSMELSKPRVDLLLGDYAFDQGTVLQEKSNRPFKPGDGMWGDYVYTIPFTESENDSVDLHFTAYAQDGTGKTVSARKTISLSYQKAKDYVRKQVSLYAQVDGQQKPYYEEGDQVKINLRLVNTGNDTQKMSHIEYVEGATYPGGTPKVVADEAERRLNPGQEITGQYAYTVTEDDAKNGVAHLNFAGWMYENRMANPSRLIDTEHVMLWVKNAQEDRAQLSLMASIIEGAKESYQEGDRVVFALTLENNHTAEWHSPRIEYFHGTEYTVQAGHLVEQVPNHAFGTMHTTYTYTITHQDAENGVAALGFIGSMQGEAQPGTVLSNAVVFPLPVEKEAEEWFTYYSAVVYAYPAEGRKAVYQVGDQVTFEVKLSNLGTRAMNSPHIGYSVGTADTAGETGVIADDPHHPFLPGMEMRGRYTYTITEEDAKRGGATVAFIGSAIDWDGSLISELSARTYRSVYLEVMPVEKTSTNAKTSLVLTAACADEDKEVYTEGDNIYFILTMKANEEGKLKDYGMVAFRGTQYQGKNIDSVPCTEGSNYMQLSISGYYPYTVTEEDARRGTLSLGFIGNASDEQGKPVQSNPIVFTFKTQKMPDRPEEKEPKLEIGASLVEGEKVNYNGEVTAYKEGDRLTFEVKMKNVGPILRLGHPRIVCHMGTSSPGAEEVVLVDRPGIGMEMGTVVHKRYTYTVTKADMERGFAAFSFTGSAEDDNDQTIFSNTRVFQIILRPDTAGEGDGQGQIALSGAIVDGRKELYAEGDRVTFGLFMRNTGEIELKGLALEQFRGTQYPGRDKKRLMNDAAFYYDISCTVSEYFVYTITRADAKKGVAEIGFSAYAHDGQKKAVRSNTVAFTLPVAKP